MPPEDFEKFADTVIGGYAITRILFPSLDSADFKLRDLHSRGPFGPYDLEGTLDLIKTSSTRPDYAGGTVRMQPSGPSFGAGVFRLMEDIPSDGITYDALKTQHPNLTRTDVLTNRARSELESWLINLQDYGLVEQRDGKYCRTQAANEAKFTVTYSTRQRPKAK